MKIGFVLLTLAAFVLLGSVVLAANHATTGNPGDVPTGSTIIATAENETFKYQDGNSKDMPAVTVGSGNISHIVASEYGFSCRRIVPDRTVTPSDVITHETYSVTNEGNASDTYTYKFLYTNGGGASNWTVKAYCTTATRTLTAGTLLTTSETLTEDADNSFYIDVVVPSSTLEAPNGSYITIYTTVETASTPKGQYTGGNAYTYGGSGEVTDVVVDTTAAPVLTLTRTRTINAPTGYTGGANDPVPGAVITFTLTYSNEGNATASNVVLVDKVPNYAEGYTRLAHVSATGSIANASVNITAAAGDATGWTVSYTTEASPVKTYGAAGWTQLGVLNGSNAFPGTDLVWKTGSTEADNARWIKWEKSSISNTEDNKKLTWGVTIK